MPLTVVSSSIAHLFIVAERLAADKPLAAYFASVAAAGPDGWAEEMDRMRDRLTGLPPEQRGDPMNVNAIAAMLPTWRAWGQVVLDAGDKHLKKVVCDTGNF